MPQRKPGFYWVRTPEGWYPAQFDPRGRVPLGGPEEFRDVWTVAGPLGVTYDEGEFLEIGPRLELPKE